MPRRSSSFIGLVCLILFGGVQESAAVLTPPVAITPPNGSIVQLPTGSNQVLLRWGAVQNATGYILDVTGPGTFIDLENIFVDATPTTVETSILGVVPGDYLWGVRAINASESAQSDPFFFTVQSPVTGGGDLPAPDLLQPPDDIVLRGQNGRVTFQWIRVEGATGYKVSLSSLGGYISLGAPVVEGSVVHQTFQISPGGNSRIYDWSVAALAGNSEGTPSKQRSFLFTPVTTSQDDFSYWLASTWQSSGSDLDFDGDHLTSFPEALGIIPFERTGERVPIDTAGPALVIPQNGSPINRQDVVLSWNRAPGARSYELDILQDGTVPETTYIVPHPSTGLVSATVPILPVGTFTWRVRTFFGSGTRATEYSETRSFTTVIVKK